MCYILLYCGKAKIVSKYYQEIFCVRKSKYYRRVHNYEKTLRVSLCCVGFRQKKLNNFALLILTNATNSLHVLSVKCYNDQLDRHSSGWGRDEITYFDDFQEISLRRKKLLKYNEKFGIFSQKSLLFFFLKSAKEYKKCPQHRNM